MTMLVGSKPLTNTMLGPTIVFKLESYDLCTFFLVQHMCVCFMVNCFVGCMCGECAGLGGSVPSA